MSFRKLRVAGKRRREMGGRRKGIGFESSRELSGHRRVGRGPPRRRCGTSHVDGRAGPIEEIRTNRLSETVEAARPSRGVTGGSEIWRFLANSAGEVTHGRAAGVDKVAMEGPGAVDGRRVGLEKEGWERMGKDGGRYRESGEGEFWRWWTQGPF
jgi:hypothetical protein